MNKILRILVHVDLHKRRIIIVRENGFHGYPASDDQINRLITWGKLSWFSFREYPSNVGGTIYEWTID